MKKTLYVSDLDGTLLNHNKCLSDFTKDTLHSLIGDGLAFTYATARSLTSAKEVTEGLNLTLPVILYNGAFIQEVESGKRFRSQTFSETEKEDVLKQCLSFAVYPRVYAFVEGRERFSYDPKNLSCGTKAYLAERKNDPRANPTEINNLLLGDVFCFSCIDAYEKLFSLNEILKKNYHTLLYRDPYTSAFWLEVLPTNATKADAVLALKELLGFERIVTFGDEKNDLSMFAVSDECYAVANADEEVKRSATGVIGTNNEDGVATYLVSVWKG